MQPGRTVTLIADKNGSCWGLAYEVAEEQAADTIKYLDVREKAGYLVNLSLNEVKFLKN